MFFFSLALETNVDTMVYLNLGFDISSLVLVLVSYFTLTATMVCISNHWDASYRSTGVVSAYAHAFLAVFFLLK